MSAKRTASPDDIDMASIFQALKASAPKTLFGALAVGAATFGALSMMAPQYRSEAELAIVAKGQAGAFADPKSLASGSESITTKMDKEAINTHVRALQSPDLMLAIADQLNLKDRPEFNSAAGPVDTLDSAMRAIGLGGPRKGESERDRVLDAFREKLEVYSAKESRFIGLRFTSVDPQLAADIANRVAETYRESLATQGVSAIDDQQKVLQVKIDKLIPELAAAETEVDRYRGEINVFTGGAQNTGLNEQQLSELTAELTRAKAARGEADARAAAAQDMMKLGSADALPDVQKSPLIQNLVQQRVRVERQISELSATLLPGHPRMQQLNADLAGLKRQLAGEIAKLVESLEKEAKVAQGREDSIKRSLDDLKVRVVTNAPEEAKLRQLEANARAKRGELETLQNQLESNRKKLDTRAQPVEAQLISTAQPTSVPVFPKKGGLSALVAFAWVLFGAAWTLTRALFRSARGGAPPVVVDRPAVAAKVQLVRNEPVLNAVPKALQSAPAPTSAAETSIAAIARRVVAARTADGGHRTLITGEAASVDAAQEAVDLANALAELGGQVILIDWSPSGRGLARLVGGAGGVGMTELLLGEANFEEVITRVGNSPVHFITSGEPLDAYGSDIVPDQANLALDALDEAYEHIVIAGPYEDARALFESIQGRVDAGVLVADAKKRASVLEDPHGSFLGFEVSEIDIIRFERKPSEQTVSQQRIARAAGLEKPETRTVQ